MNDKKEFKYAWRDFYLKEGERHRSLHEAYMDTINKFVGRLKVEPKKLAALEELPPKCNPEMLANPELKPDVETLEAAGPGGFAAYTAQLGCFLIDGDVQATEKFLADHETSGIVSKIEQITAFGRKNIKDFFSLSAFAPEPEPVTEAEGVEEEGEYAISAPTISPEIMNPTQARGPGGLPISASRAKVTEHLEAQLIELFNGIKHLHVRFLLGNAMIIYWRTLMEEDFLELKNEPELAQNARMIAEIEIDWLMRMLRGIKSEVDTITKTKQKELDWIPGEYPADPEPEPDPYSDEREEQLVYYLTPEFEGGKIYNDLYSYWKRWHTKKKQKTSRAAFKSAIDEFVNFIGPYRTMPYNERKEHGSEIEKLGRSNAILDRKNPDKLRKLKSEFDKLPRNRGAYKFVKVLPDRRDTLPQIVNQILANTRRKVVKAIPKHLYVQSGDHAPPPPKLTARKGYEPEMQHGAPLQRENKQNQRWKYLAGIK